MMCVPAEKIPFADRVVAVEHRPAPAAHVLEAPRGTQLTVLRADDAEWSGWYLCELSGGTQGWVHGSLLEKRDDRGRTRLKEDYSARELSLEAETPVTVLLELGGWGWVRNEAGREGWVPLRNLKSPSSQ